MNVVVLGAGYVGLVTAACLASVGHHVTCVDRKLERIHTLLAGQVPIYEPGLEALITHCVTQGRFRATSVLSDVMEGADMSVIAVGTPTVNGEIDLSQVASVADEIGRLLPGINAYHTVVLKSTCTPGTTEGLLLRTLEYASGLKAGADFGLSMNPEFLREGSAIDDFMNPDRIVIGSINTESATYVESLYEPFCCPKVHTTPKNAEMSKYVANSLLANLISFSNEVATLCEQIPGLNASKVMEAVHLDRRLTSVVDGTTVTAGAVDYLRAGVGYGGSCFPKDTRALQRYAQSNEISTPMLDATIDTNHVRADAIVQLLAASVGPVNDLRVVVLGLSFRPGTDDVRESPGIKLIKLLLSKGARVAGWDPVATKNAREQLDDDIELFNELPLSLRHQRVAIVACAWPEIKTFNWHLALELMDHPVILDGRSVLDTQLIPRGIHYIPIGQTAITQPLNVEPPDTNDRVARYV